VPSNRVLEVLYLVGTLWFGVPFRGGSQRVGNRDYGFPACRAGARPFPVNGGKNAAAIKEQHHGIETANHTEADFPTQETTLRRALTCFKHFPKATVMTTLSGFGTLVSSMPPFFQKLSYFNPLRHVVLLLRDVYLKGVGLDVLWQSISFLAGFAALMLSISILRFRKTLEQQIRHCLGGVVLR
jgi:hypothetical protein